MHKKQVGNVENIIALCHILDNFEEFNKSWVKVIPKECHYEVEGMEFIEQLNDISLGKFKLGFQKVKKFYKENKVVIDTINKYSNIKKFMGCSGNISNNFNELEFFHKYLLDHKKDVNKVLLLLEKINELDFEEFYFNEELDFTKETYEATNMLTYGNYICNQTITFVDNIEIIPGYSDYYFSYKTLGSNYKFDLSHVKIYSKIRCYGSNLVLNSLTFDPKLLPTNLDRESTYDKIVNLKEKQKEKNPLVNSFIKDSVNLSTGVTNLEKELNMINKIINKLSSEKNKKELVLILSDVKKDVEKLKTLSDQYDVNILEEEPLLTKEILEKEKALHLKRGY